MIRAKRVYFQALKSDIDRLFACNRESARVWNACLQLAKSYYQEHGENGFRKRNCKRKPKVAFRFIVNPFKRFVTSICLQGMLPINRCKKGSPLPVIPIVRRKTIIPNGQDKVLPSMKKEELPYPWVFNRGNDKNRSSYLRLLFLKDPSKRSNCVMTMDGTYPLPMKMEKRRKNIRNNNRLG